MAIEDVDQLGKIHQRAAQAIDLVDHHHIDPVSFNVGNQGFQAWAFKSSTGHATVIIMAMMELPAPQNGSQHVMTCSCGAEHPVCDECGQGWLIKRVGRFGEFMGCSRYPRCLGARQLRTKTE